MCTITVIVTIIHKNWRFSVDTSVNVSSPTTNTYLYIYCRKVSTSTPESSLVLIIYGITD